ncbi:hypothetical protein XAP6164_3100013 [Xanthomonas phaseoli pv. phaseoli]|uniref:Uncharacterized protein n=1 Tax=Xanthomonas campestris pv. phaseoli TaxID=317013 RepID=A0ABY1TWW8_XANCH|nr:hypothetical protein XAP6984_790015 [Xanthomonas phaseoli pv. phaseoli]SOO29193.1 hypothetical protein XAP6164_3100013 [Xanthomonas phaseoli pv. phaseoli]
MWRRVMRAAHRASRKAQPSAIDAAPRQRLPAAYRMTAVRIAAHPGCKQMYNGNDARPPGPASGR